MTPDQPMPLTLRPLEPADRTPWEALWQAYLVWYKQNLPQAVTEANWQRFMNPLEPLHVWGAFEGETLPNQQKLLGIVQCVIHRTTWSERSTCYLQDLFTVEAARGKGVGRALINHVYAEAEKNNWCRVYWVTQETNAEAQVLYNKVAERPGFIVYRKNV